MREGRAAAAGRQDEFLEPRQGRVVVLQRLVQPQHRGVLQQLPAGPGEFAAEVEQLVLDGDQQLAHIVRQRFGEQHAEVGIEFVDIAHGLHAQVVLGHTAAVGEAGGAVVAGAGGDLGEAVAHMAVCKGGETAIVLSAGVRCGGTAAWPAAPRGDAGRGSPATARPAACPVVAHARPRAGPSARASAPPAHRSAVHRARSARRPGSAAARSGSWRNSGVGWLRCWHHGQGAATQSADLDQETCR
mmetsp:Transcript_59447/g.140625  ORF Transcript_59447/g.140625 Transcript_59447/m.140625 type:complete len:244 (+) Transcript_59447:345-1076(+)